MAIGDTVRAELMRVDPSAILEAGRVQGQLGRQVGQTLGGLATTYFDTKKRRQELEGERKGISESLKMLAKVQPEMRDVYEAQSEMLNDTEIPLSTRVAAGIRSLQNVGMAEKFRSARLAEKLQADKFATEQRLANFKLAADQLGFTKDIFDLMEKRRKRDEEIAMRKVYTPQMEARGKVAEMQKKETEASQVVQPVFDESGQIIPSLARRGTTLLRQDPRTPGQFSILGTGVENIQQVRTDKAEDIISLGRQRAEDFDITAKPIKPRIAAGGDLGGFFEDAMLYAGGLVGLSGKEMDEKIYDLGLGDREEQTARLTFVNAQIRPMLLRAVTSRGNVYSQKQIDTEILASPKENNTAVQKKLREYPTLLENALTNAETVLRDPEIKPGTSVYEDARFIAMQVPTILRQIRSSMGMSGMGTMGTMGQSPNVDALLESLPRDTNRSRTDLDVTDILSQ
jgi:hypothetical protein